MVISRAIHARKPRIRYIAGLDAAILCRLVPFLPNRLFDHLVRGQMKLKIRAMSSESKASAYIIGSLPFVVFGLVSMVNPGYMAGFFTDQRLIIAGLGGLCWMGIGVFIMAKMINFEI